MTTNLSDLSYMAFEFIALNMRAIDRKEIYNLLDTDSPIAFAWEAHRTILNNGRGRIAWHNGKPAAWVGLFEMRPRVWQVTMGGTDDLPKVAFQCLRWLRDTIPELVKPPLNGYRLQCDARCGPEYAENHKFLRSLGAKEEGPPRMIGKDQGVYQCFVWLLGENGEIRGDKAVLGG